MRSCDFECEGKNARRAFVRRATDQAFPFQGGGVMVSRHTLGRSYSGTVVTAIAEL
jgi:hypothetical protein